VSINRGQIWLAALDPTVGSEQSGTRPIIIFQNNLITQFSTTAITIPLTTNLKRATLPTSLLLPKGSGGLSHDSVALCHQVRVLDKTRLLKLLGTLTSEQITDLEAKMMLAMGYDT
jgi:mRNA interferase MazF